MAGFFLSEIAAPFPPPMLKGIAARHPKAKSEDAPFSAEEKGGVTSINSAIR